MPTMLSVVVIGFSWQLIYSPLWGVAKMFLSFFGLGFLFGPWLGEEFDSTPDDLADLGVAVRRHSNDPDLHGAPCHS